MIDQDKRRTIYFLHKEGMSLRKISRQMNVSINTVVSIIDQKGLMPDTQRKDKILIDTELLRKLNKKCSGWNQRIHEILTEEYGIEIGYSTLTRMMREVEPASNKTSRCDQVPDKPGEEMQHDTTTYMLHIGEKRIRVVASIIYYRYSKVRYLKFYRSFNRFNMKCFLHEALMFWGYAAPTCIIDNTNLARLSGTGKRAIIVPEMEQFALTYGFKFICHEIMHSNRKAGNERSFFTTETNFIPGRTFESMEDLNRQAFSWATDRMVNRPVGKTRLIPIKAFEFEQSYLNKVPSFVTPPYLVHERVTDQYGYASFDGNFYWIPGTLRHNVKILQYGSGLKIYHKRELLGEYIIPSCGVKNEKISPNGQAKPKMQPNNRKKPTVMEEKKLRAAAPCVDAYLNLFVCTLNGKKRHRFIRRLYGLHQKLAPALFLKSIRRALKYRITDIPTLERIAVLQIQSGIYDVHAVDIDMEYQNRKAYLDGCFTDDVDLSVYKCQEDENE
jgi:transposase